MNKTFNGEKLYLFDIRTINPYNNNIYYGTFESPKSKKFDLKMFTNPIAITGLYKKQYLVYSLNDQIQVFELGTLAEEEIKPKTSPNTFIAKFKDFYVSTSKLEFIELYKKHCRKAKNNLQEILKDGKRKYTDSAIENYERIIKMINDTYLNFLKQIKEL
jgi:hypothetical protein